MLKAPWIRHRQQNSVRKIRLDMMNEILIREGYAYLMTYPPNIKYEEVFREAFKDGRESKRGLWADSLSLN